MLANAMQPKEGYVKVCDKHILAMLQRTFIMNDESGCFGQCFTCNVCSKSFTRLFNASMHIKIHLSPKNKRGRKAASQTAAEDNQCLMSASIPVQTSVRARRLGKAQIHFKRRVQKALPTGLDAEQVASESQPDHESE